MLDNVHPAENECNVEDDEAHPDQKHDHVVADGVINLKKEAKKEQQPYYFASSTLKENTLPRLSHPDHVSPLGHPLGPLVSVDDLQKGHLPILGDLVHGVLPLLHGAVVAQHPDVVQGGRGDWTAGGGVQLQVGEEAGDARAEEENSYEMSSCIMHHSFLLFSHFKCQSIQDILVRKCGNDVWISVPHFYGRRKK